jgi:CheY-like chemotaxis protein
MLRQLIGEDIELRLVTHDAGNVKADPNQLEQVVMNLVINARDAMPRGGRLVIETGPLEVAEAGASAWPGLSPGPFAMVTISDTGVWMDEATRSRLFEPFFTTKALGYGTGLGLSMVYGIVQQSGGAVSVESTLGCGTTFRVVLPTVQEHTPDTAEPSRVAEAATGHETILVAEDEESVRRLIRVILERLGYTVLEAMDGDEALSVWRRERGRIDLLITDIVMPHVDGPALVRRVRGSRPDAKVIYVSGYTDDAIIRRGEWEPGTPFLQKPFTSLALARAVRAVLDGASTPGPPAAVQ